MRRGCSDADAAAAGQGHQRAIAAAVDRIAPDQIAGGVGGTLHWLQFLDEIHRLARRRAVRLPALAGEMQARRVLLVARTGRRGVGQDQTVDAGVGGGGAGVGDRPRKRAGGESAGRGRGRADRHAVEAGRGHRAYAGTRNRKADAGVVIQPRVRMSAPRVIGSRHRIRRSGQRPRQATAANGCPSRAGAIIQRAAAEPDRAVVGRRARRPAAADLNFASLNVQ